MTFQLDKIDDPALRERIKKLYEDGKDVFGTDSQDFTDSLEIILERRTDEDVDDIFRGMEKVIKNMRNKPTIN